MNKKIIQYHWDGISSDGKKCHGVINGHSKEQAKLNLKNQGILVLRLYKNSLGILLFQSMPFNDKQRLDFTEELHLLTQTGVPLSDALAMIAASQVSHQIKNLLLSIQNKMIEGMSLYDALSAFPHYFSNNYRQLIHAGEKTGKLNASLHQLITYQTRIILLKSKITKAMIYPITVLIVAILVTMGLLVFVVPQFQRIYQSFNAQLPSLTQWVIHLSNAFCNHFLLIIFIVISIVLLMRLFFRKSIIRYQLSKLALHMPITKNGIILAQTSQWSQVMATTLSAGIALADALEIANQAVTHPVFQQEMRVVTSHIIQGASIQSALTTSTLFPTRAKQLIAIGENADALPEIMEKIATLYHQMLNDTLDNLSKLIEPVIMIGIAVGIAALIIVMYLPVFRMGQMM